jgi:hypothetical protein
VDSFSAAQILPMPVDVNRAGFVRTPGWGASSRMLPRALLPVTMDKGVVNLASVRDPADATESAVASDAGETTEPLLFWIDLHVPTETPAGEYATTCELLSSDSPEPIAQVPLKLTIHDFVLPDERHLVMTSQLAWEDLVRLYPQQFETVRPPLINRSDSAYAGDGEGARFDREARAAHRTEVVVPRLQPTAKWPAGKPPQVDWGDLDSGARAVAERRGVRGQDPDRPLAAAAGRFPRPLRSHVAARVLESRGDAFRSEGMALALARRAGASDAGTRGRRTVDPDVRRGRDDPRSPSEGPRDPAAGGRSDPARVARQRASFIEPLSVTRLLAASPGIVFNQPIQEWSLKIRPQHWLRTDIPGLVPYVGAGGDERDVRVWSWLAFLQKERPASLIQWGSPLPRATSSSEPADPNDLVWFYPGSWFGVDEPVASIQLKWLRRAQQDFEYLWLARQRGEVTNASLIARFITRPSSSNPAKHPIRSTR